jgi:hypothetical protein
MRKRIEWNWEHLDETTSRIKVIGGWLVRTVLNHQKHGVGVGLAFVADRDHEWNILPPIQTQAASSQVNKAADFEPK